MKNFCFLFLATVQIAQCLLTNLVVKRLDKTLIARKRQDTLDMCRIFTEENQKLEHTHVPKIIKSYTPAQKPRFKRDVGEESHRYKRDVEDAMNRVNPALNPEDAKRVENIVDKLYDDMEEKGERVTYRQVRTTSAVKVNGKLNKTLLKSRRFDFAPAILEGPVSHLKVPPGMVDEPFKSKARWKLGIVPYYIDFKTYDAQLSEIITRAFDYVEKATCIRLQKLRERPTDKESLESVPWVYISNPTGIRQCVHSNENRRVNGVVMTVFGYDCMSLGDIVHEVMHILGFSHEHLRSDRDQHISIIWENIKPGYKKFFDLNKFGSEYEIESLPYDYSSILHYPARAFSKNGKATIITEYGIKIGQREGLSEIDVEKVSLIYSNECVKRNRDYLLQTCPSVVKASTKPVSVSQKEVENYFGERLWPFGIINYKFRDMMEFTVEERENIKSVFRHIEQETCLQFRDVGISSSEVNSQEQMEIAKKEKDKRLDTKSQVKDKENPSDDAPTELTDKPSYDAPIHEGDISNNYAPNYGGNTPNINDPIDGGDTTNTDAPINGEDIPKNDAPVNGGETPSTDDPINEGIKPSDDNVVAGDIPSNAPADPTEPDLNTVAPEEMTTLDRLDLPEVLAQDSDDNIVSDDEERQAAIIITQPNKKRDESELRRKGLDLKNMSLSKKKDLLRKAKQQKKRTRRDTNQGQEGPRRHANSLLVLRRSPVSVCPCPKAGRPNGDLVLDITAGCFNSVNDLLHFFVHMLGLDHQHNMHDRDNYLHIVWQNLTEEVRLEMQNKLPPAASVGFSYDYQSVMHYPWLQIKDGKTNVMYPIWNDGWAMGHWHGLSSVDVQKLNLLYYKQCTEREKQEKQ